MSERRKVSVEEGYAKWATGYDAYENPLVMIEEPIVRRLVGDVRGASVLDVACGTGRHTKWLADRGARVTGVDRSAAMLEVAKKKLEGLDAELLVGDVDALPVPASTFDVVVSALVMEHVEHVAPALAEAHRALRSGGVLVLSVYHPAFLWKGVPPHFKAEGEDQEYEMPAFVHLPSEYVAAVLALGMGLTDFLEPLVDDALIARCPRMKKHQGLPLAIILRAEKR
jgi:ubiquinone/menaquinone biosynthesis C-methylase UbiE